MGIAADERTEGDGRESGDRMNWIPCDERQPEIQGEYLVTVEYPWMNEVAIECYCEKWLTHKKVVAWMELPSPYGENHEGE